MWRLRGRVEPLTGVEKLLTLADEIRRSDATVAPAMLYHECVQAFARGEVEFDAVTSLYRHAMIHAGAIRPRGGGRFTACPTCGVEL